jgi:organic hydroperoxide reductase OsmC/OhrA
MLVASLSSCHMLWYLHLCSDAGIVVTAYEDEAEGTMTVDADGGGRFVEVVLRPRVTLADPARTDEARALHGPAHEKCFIASSVNFPVRTEGTFS